MRKSHITTLFYQKMCVETLTGALWTLINVYFEKEYSFFRSVVKISVSLPFVL